MAWRAFHKAIAGVALGLALLTGFAVPARAGGIQICPQPFALCAASTCQPTGKKITVQGAQFDEAVCECPVLPGPSLANTNLMGDSCKNPDGHRTVWSLFAPKSSFPQKMAGWNVAPAQFQKCSGASNPHGYTNCWSFACDKVRPIKAANGTTVLIADCHCPLNESPITTGPDKPGSDFSTQAGNGAAEPYCNERPVGAAIPGG